ncbi:MAG: inner membrane-spanning protein YciB [Pseudomonadales bacterium]
MKQLIEFIPIALFVGVYFTTKDIYLATALLMAGIAIQVAYEYWHDKTISKRTQFIFWVALLAGGATLIFKNQMFIMWKPTIVNGLFGVALLASQYIGRENLLQKLMGDHVNFPSQVWRNLTLGWSAGFFFAGALNLVVAYNFSTDFWVAYKLVGGMGLTIFYLIVTFVYLIAGGYISELSAEEDAASIANKQELP